MKARKIFCVVAYDIQNDKKRNKVSKSLEEFGVRINLSVFECMLTSSQLNKLQIKTAKLIDPQTDLIVYYTICVDCYTKIRYQPEQKKVYHKIKIL